MPEANLVILVVPKAEGDELKDLARLLNASLKDSEQFKRWRFIVTNREMHTISKTELVAALKDANEAMCKGDEKDAGAKTDPKGS